MPSSAPPAPVSAPKTVSRARTPPPAASSANSAAAPTRHQSRRRKPQQEQADAADHARNQQSQREHEAGKPRRGRRSGSGATSSGSFGTMDRVRHGGERRGDRLLLEHATRAGGHDRRGAGRGNRPTRRPWTVSARFVLPLGAGNVRRAQSRRAPHAAGPSCTCERVAGCADTRDPDIVRSRVVVGITKRERDQQPQHGARRPRSRTAGVAWPEYVVVGRKTCAAVLARGHQRRRPVGRNADSTR